MPLSDFLFFRKAVSKKVGEDLGIDFRAPKVETANRRMYGFAPADIANMAVNADDDMRMTISDNDDPDFGLSIFIVGISALGGPDVVR